MQSQSLDNYFYPLITPNWSDDTVAEDLGVTFTSIDGWGQR